MAGRNQNKPSKRRPTSYVPEPTISQAYAERYRMVMAAATGHLSVSEAAQRLGMSRNHFQSLLHRGQAALIEAIVPQSAGRKGRSAKEVELEEQVQRLQRELTKVQTQAETSDRLLGVVSQMLKGKVRVQGTQSTRTKRKKSKPTQTEQDGEEPEPAVTLEHALHLKSDGIPMKVSAAALGVGASTLRRWRCRERRGQPMRRRRGPCPGPRMVRPELARDVAGMVRALGGLVGADSLRLAFPGVSRRRALVIKRDTLTRMERERKHAAASVRVTVPGVLRGFDAMHVRRGGRPAYALVAADGCVPYRTTVRCVERYDGQSVCQVLAEDIEQNGAPLVLRMDRASCHRGDEVQALLDQHGVLLMHGPAHYPCFYGQLERQNREHRGWLEGVDVAPEDVDDVVLGAMKHALNDLWHRRTLGGDTATERWKYRPQLTENRGQLRDEVDSLAARIEPKLDDHKDATLLARRLAIQHALKMRGYLNFDEGRRC